MPKNNILTIGNVEILKGKSVRIDIELPSFYGSPSFLRTYVIRGKKDGPTVFVSAAIHGDELNGIEIIRRIRRLSLIKKIRGTLILIPIVNNYGVQNLSRYLPDRRDLNRSFPGSSKGSLASRVAEIFYTEVVSKCDLGIDLHTASIHKDNLPQIRANLDNEFTLALAKNFAAPVILHSELRDGSLRAAVQDNDIPVLLYEAGEALRLDERSIKIGVRGIMNVLRHMQMLPESTRKTTHKPPVITKSSSWIRASESGMIQTLKKLGDLVQKDEVIAKIYDLIDDTSYDV
ncbi:MAG: succinylglutamate desuccinylase/aspartoacylase family protein, partial [Thiovulaceae bacterium]|nr:succinylglutamate desuccinylase/aspartoacylase family protein [Sulfurimonadaceae bacterium]